MFPGLLEQLNIFIRWWDLPTILGTLARHPHACTMAPPFPGTTIFRPPKWMFLPKCHFVLERKPSPKFPFFPLPQTKLLPVPLWQGVQQSSASYFQPRSSSTGMGACSHHTHCDMLVCVSNISFLQRFYLHCLKLLYINLYNPPLYLIFYHEDLFHSNSL